MSCCESRLNSRAILAKELLCCVLKANISPKNLGEEIIDTGDEEVNMRKVILIKSSARSL